MSERSALTRRRGYIAAIRLTQAGIAVLVLCLTALLAGLNPVTEWWFWTAATAMVTAAVAQPYYTGPIAAMLYGVAGIAAGLMAVRAEVEILWTAYFALAGVVVVAGIVAKLDPDGRAGQSGKWLATRFGRPAWLGIAAVTIELLRSAPAIGLATTATMGLGILVGTIASVPDWYRFVITARPGIGRIAFIEAAIEPNVLLVSSSTRIAAGQLVQVVGHGESDGVVVGNLAHKGGNRVQIALSAPWTQVVSASGGAVDVSAIDSDDGPVLGLVADGSTDKELDLRALGSLPRGETVYWIDDKSDHQYLYQVVGQHLRHENWDGAAVIAQHAKAALLGIVTPNGLVPDYQLPPPFAPVFSAAAVSAELPKTFEKIGTIAGTKVPIGISIEKLREHHLAILGMSGMGKSTIARKILRLLSNGAMAVAIDGTGEYQTKFGLPSWDVTTGLVSDGMSVFEPSSGSSAAEARNFIQRAMDTAIVEYKSGTPKSRSILIEEAHSFLPEWNFVVAKGESDIVAQSCRMLLQARKYGLNFVLVSQRTAVINKSALSQCESYVILRTLDDTSLQYVESVVGSEYRDVATSLKRFQAICVGPAFSTSVPVVVDLDPGP